MKNAALLQKWIHLVPVVVLVICILVFVAKFVIGNVLNYLFQESRSRSSVLKIKIFVHDIQK
jgi:hypothetical protein